MPQMKIEDGFRSAVEVGFGRPLAQRYPSIGVRPRPARGAAEHRSGGAELPPGMGPLRGGLAAQFAGGISPRRFAMILSMVRLGSTAASKYRIVSGAMW